MVLLPENSTAQLVMLNGNLCSLAELALILEQFDYEEDQTEPGLWRLIADDVKGSECLLRVSNNGDTFTLYGDAPDHFAAVNYVVQKAGWAECSVMSCDDSVEAKLLARLVSVTVSGSTQAAMPASTLRLSAAPVVPAEPVSRGAAAPNTVAERGHTPEATPNADPIGGLDEAHERIESLTIQKNTLEERCEVLESENGRLRRDNTELGQRLATRPMQSREPLTPAVHDDGHVADTDANALIAAIERHVSTSLDLSTINGNQLVQDLKGLGFEFRVRLVRAAS
jgi:hypothetical protein